MRNLRFVVALVIFLLGMVLVGAAYPQTFHAKSDWDMYMAAAEIALDRGDYSEAEKQAKAALEYSERFGREDERPAGSYTFLGRMYEAQHRYAEAEKAYAEALGRWRLMLRESVELTRHLQNLAFVYRDDGKYSQAEALLKEALTLSERTYQGKGSYVAMSAEELAYLYVVAEKYEKAEPLYKRAIAEKEEAYGREGLALVSTLDRYAELLRKMGRATEAERVEARAKGIQGR